MGIRLTVFAPSEDERANEVAVHAISGGRATIGRGRDCDLVLPDATVSQLHATVRSDGPKVTLVDESSSNGTRVNGRATVPGRGRALATGDVIHIGPFGIRVELAVAIAEATPPLTSAAHARAMVRAVLGDAPLGPQRLEPLGAAPDAPWPVVHAPMVLGRGADSDLALDDEDASRRHAELFVRAGALHVRDLESKNGTLVDGARIDEAALPHGAVLEVGATRFRVHDPAAEAVERLHAGPDETGDPPLPPMRDPAEPPATAHTDDESIEAPEPEPAATEPAPMDDGDPARGLRAAPVLSQLGERAPSGDGWLYGLAVTVLIASLAGLFWVFSGR